MSFVIKKRIDLSHLGTDWEGAYAVFKPFTFRENTDLLKLRKSITDISKTSDEDIEKMTNDMLKTLQDKFIEGMGFDGEKLAPFYKDDLGDLPLELIQNIMQQLQGMGDAVSPKASTPSNGQ